MPKGSLGTFRLGDGCQFLLDEESLKKYPERRYGQTRTLHDLNWGTVHFLQDSSVTLNFTFDDSSIGDGRRGSRTRSLRIYGSPWAPAYTISAFQYPSEQNIWTHRIPANSDIVVIHGPTRLHLDIPSFRHAGCPYLAREIFRVRPRLAVFGHINASYGREDVILDNARRAHDGIVGDWGEWGTLFWMAVGVLVARIRMVYAGREAIMQSEGVTTFVNAAIVREPWNKILNERLLILSNCLVSIFSPTLRKHSVRQDGQEFNQMKRVSELVNG
ncbi:Calcineurin-like phosphoesterase [Aspergillus sp. HF37]|nr:Calcineurin-like phosphoesterase [Aspergillus sp. HF37]